MIYNYQEKKVSTKEIEILRCPFCGSDKLNPIHISGSYGYTHSEDYVECCECGATGGKIEDKNCGNHMKEAIKKWNRRC